MNCQSHHRCHQNHHRRHHHRLRTVGACSLFLLLPGGSALEANANVAVDAKTQGAMVESIQDEYRAKAFYQAVIEKFGPIRPFTNIVQAEDRHEKRWIALFKQHNLPIPDDRFAGKVTAPESLKAAYELAIQAEIDNIQMYDRFLEFIQEPDLRATIIQLRNVSETKHKVAFERVASRTQASAPGQGQGQGRAHRRGMGQGPGNRF